MAIDSMERFRPEGRELAEAKSAYSELLVVDRRYDEAESLLLDSFQRLMHLRGPSSVSTRETRQRIIDLYKKWERPEKLAAFLAAEQPSDPGRASGMDQ